MLKVAFFGYSDILLKELVDSRDFNLKFVVGVKGRISNLYYKIIEQSAVLYYEIVNRKQIEDMEDKLRDIDIVLMYKFEYIIPMPMLGYARFFNFHGGNLRTNRGAHAVVWSVLLRERETCLSVYELTGGIDEGRLVGEYYVGIAPDDSPVEVNNKLAKGLPYLLNCISRYLDGSLKAELITGGKYRRKIEKSDYTIDIRNDSVDVIRGKVLSQKPYNGVVINYDYKEYRIHDYKILMNKAGNRSIKKTTKGFEIQTEEGTIFLW